MLESSRAVLSNSCQRVLLVLYAEHVCDRQHISRRPLVDLRRRLRGEDDVLAFGQFDKLHRILHKVLSVLSIFEAATISNLELHPALDSQLDPRFLEEEAKSLR